MSKTLETKKRIFNLLKNKDMTVTELSKELGLSNATVTEHVNDLVRVGAIERIDNEHFRKLKYYKPREFINPVIAKYIIGVLVVAAIFSGFYLYSAGKLSPNYLTNPKYTTSAVAQQTTTISTPGIPGGVGAFACPMIFYNLNGTVFNYSGFSLYYLNSSLGTVPDYVIANGTTGNLYARERITNVLNESDQNLLARQHYAFLSKIGVPQSFNISSEGINMTINPENFTVIENETLNFTVNVAVNRSAPDATYWLRIDGPCGGGVQLVLVTVGNAPYSGNVTAPISTYA